MQKTYPFYVKSTIILFGVILFVFALFHLRDVLVPLAFAVMLAILLNPLVNKLQRRKVPRVLAIVLALVIAIVIILAIVYFLSSQIASFSSELPLLEKKFTMLFSQLQQYLQETFSLSMEKQQELITDAQAQVKPIVGIALGSLLGTLGVVILLPVYTFLFLYYKKLMLNFLFEVFAQKNSTDVAEALEETKKAIQSYMVGLSLEAVVVAAMNFLALWALGIRYALLLAVIGALLNVVPYIGGLIAISLPVIVATLTKDGFSTQLAVIAAYTVIQFIDNQFLVPMIVSSKVRINAMISIIIVLLGAAVWGVAGMFLSIPFIAVVKIVCDRVPEMKPWGKLLGDSIPTRHKGEIWGRFRKATIIQEGIVEDAGVKAPEEL